MTKESSVTEKQVLHLKDASLRLPSDGSHDILKSHLIWTCLGLVGYNKILKKSEMCDKCCQSWSVGNFSLKLKPSSPGPRMIKILKKAKKGDTLSRIESSLLKRHLEHRGCNDMILMCMACKHHTTIKCKKPTTRTITASANPETPESTKKKKKKDRFSGLNISAVISATKSPMNSSLKCSTPNKKKDPVGLNSFENKIRSPRTPLTASAVEGVPCVKKDVPETLQQSISRVSKASLNIKDKMKLLRNEIQKTEEVNREAKREAAFQQKKQHEKRRDKLKAMIKKEAMEKVTLEDRIKCLLQTG